MKARTTMAGEIIKGILSRLYPDTMGINNTPRNYKNDLTQMTKIHEFDPTIYPFKILVTKDFDKEDLKREYKVFQTDGQEVAITDELDTNGTTTARFMQVIDKKDDVSYLLVIYHPEDFGVGNCTHEAFHITLAYLNDIGMSFPTPYSDEQYAYFAQWVANCIWSVLTDKVDEMNGTTKELGL